MPQVFFIGAGPGDPDLITVKGKKRIESADAVLYAGSLVPEALVACAREDAEIRDSSGMNLEETHAFIMRHARNGGTVARVHTGDPSLYGAILEQMRLLDRDGVEYEIVPGVTAAFAAAAEAKAVFTVPERCQTLVLTRMPGRTPVPEAERLRDLARTGAALAVYLSGSKVRDLADELRSAGLSGDAPVLCAHRVGWPGQKLVSTTVDGLPSAAKEHGLGNQTVFLILPETGDNARSKLYDPDFSHEFRS